MLLYLYVCVLSSLERVLSPASLLPQLALALVTVVVGVLADSRFAFSGSLSISLSGPADQD